MTFEDNASVDPRRAGVLSNDKCARTRGGFQREMSQKSGAKRSLQDDRDTLHRTDTHPRPAPRLPRGQRARGLELTGRTSAYAFARRTVVRLWYHRLGRADKARTKRFLEGVTGFSRAQVTRLIRQQRRTGHIRSCRRLTTSRHRRWSARQSRGRRKGLGVTHPNAPSSGPIASPP